MNIFLYIMTVCVWGSTWFVLTFQLGSVPVSVSIFYRFALAAFLLLGWCLIRKLKLRYSLQHHLLFASQGFFLFSMNYMAAYEATNYISSGLTAIGFSMVLVFNIINSAIFYRTPITLPIIVGALCGMTGIGAIFWPSISGLDLSSDSVIGMGISLTAGLLASFGNILSVQAQKEKLPVTETNAFGMAYGTVWILMFILFKGHSFHFELTYSYTLSILYLSVFGSIVAFGCYLTLLGRIGASKAAYALVLTPVVALVFSTFFEEFVWDFYTVTGIAHFIGNVIIQAGKSPKQTKKGPALTLRAT